MSAYWLDYRYLKLYIRVAWALRLSFGDSLCKLLFKDTFEMYFYNFISIFSKNFLIKYVDCTLILLNSLINIIHDRGRGVWSIEHENWFWLWASYIHFSCTLHHWASLLVFLTMDILYIFKWSNFVVYLRIFTF